MSLEWYLAFGFFFLVGTGIGTWINNKLEENAERRRGAEAAQEAWRRGEGARRKEQEEQKAYAAYAATYLKEIKDFSLWNQRLQKIDTEKQLVIIRASVGSAENIRELRKLTGYGFKEAKDIINMVMAGGTWVYPGKDCPDISSYKHLKFDRKTVTNEH